MNDPVQFEDNDSIVCNFCDTEFSVQSSDSEAEVAFCPFCGTELGDEDDIDDEEEGEGYYE